MKRAAYPVAVSILTAGLASTAVVVGVSSTHVLIPSKSLAAAPFLLIALVASGALPTVYTARGDRDTNDLFEAALMPVILLFTGIGAVALAATAKLVSLLYLKVQPIKVAFNVAQWACVAAVSSAVYQAVGNHSMRGADVAALGAAMAAGMVINHASVMLAVALASHQSLGSVLKQFQPAMFPVWIVGGAVNLSFGLLFAALAASTPAATALVLVPLAMLYGANRSYAAVRADRVRLEGLQRATHELAAAVDPIEGCEPFLDIVRSHFESDEVELVLLDPPRVMRSGTTLGPDDASVALAEVVATLGTSVRITATNNESLAHLLGAKQRHDCIAVPLRLGREVVGALVSYGREGLEGFEEGEMAVLEALGAEAMSALHRSELTATIVEERSRYHDLVSRSSDGIFSIATSGCVDSWNPAMGAITGCSADEIVGRTLAPLHLSDADGKTVLLEQWAHCDALPTELRAVTRDGSTRWLGCAYSRDSAATSLVVVARDITRAKEMDQLKDDFVATVSHELRTPMTTILGFTHMLLEPGALPEHERDAALAQVRKGMQRLDRLVVNLLEVSRIAAGGQTTTQHIDLAAIARGVVSEHREGWPDRMITLEGDGPLHARANATAFEQTLSNLVVNALKYAPNSPICVRLEHADGAAVVTVTDHGPGIPAYEHQRIFERFERLDHATSQAGTGLGLYIAHQLTRSMGGELTVDSDSGRGATFAICLPASHLTLVRDTLTA